MSADLIDIRLDTFNDLTRAITASLPRAASRDFQEFLSANLQFFYDVSKPVLDLKKELEQAQAAGAIDADYAAEVMAGYLEVLQQRILMRRYMTRAAAQSLVDTMFEVIARALKSQIGLDILPALQRIA